MWSSCRRGPHGGGSSGSQLSLTPEPSPWMQVLGCGLCDCWRSKWNPAEPRYSAFHKGNILVPPEWRTNHLLVQNKESSQHTRLSALQVGLDGQSLLFLSPLAPPRPSVNGGSETSTPKLCAHPTGHPLQKLSQLFFHSKLSFCSNPN